MASTYTIAKLIAPMDAAEFMSECWEKKPAIIRRNDPKYYSDLLSLEAFDRAITTVSPQHPQCFIANAAREVQAEEYTTGTSAIDPTRLYQQYADGGTIVYSQLETVYQPLADFCRSLEREVNTHFQCNIYCSPPNAQGFPTHYDSHDVFVLQIHGTKKWYLYNTPVDLPFRGQPFRRAETPKGEVTQEFELSPGDVVYIPRGVMHDAKTTDEATLHITVGIIAHSWTELLLESVARVALSDPDFRRALPPGFARASFDRGAARAHFKDLLSRVAEKADFDAALDHFADDLVSTRNALLEGQLNQLLRLNKLTAGDRAGARPNLVYRHRIQDEQLVVSCYGAEMRLPEHAAEPTLFALENEGFTISELPGDLDDAGKVVLIKRLVREGMVRVL